MCFCSFVDAAIAQIYSRSLLDALPIYGERVGHDLVGGGDRDRRRVLVDVERRALGERDGVVMVVGAGLRRVIPAGVVKLAVAAAVGIDLDLGDGAVAGVDPGLGEVERV